MVDWVKDSVSKGYSLPYVNYRIYTGQSTRANVVNSTQIANRSMRTDPFNPDSTQLSAIMSDVSIAETTSALTLRENLSPKPLRKSYKSTLDNIDIGLVKNAKGCLDGCTVSINLSVNWISFYRQNFVQIWLCGFDGSDIDKLKKIINIGGAIRLDEHGLNVEYVIVGKPNLAEVSTLKSLEKYNRILFHQSLNIETIFFPSILFQLKHCHGWLAGGLH